MVPALTSVTNNTDVEIDVLCYTKSGSLTDHSFTLLYQARKKSDATRPEVAFVWANAPTKSSYTPNGEYSYNESGGTNTIKRSSKGNYAVYLPGFATTHSTVMVGAYGAPAHCQVSDWGSYGSGTVVNVNCTDTEGVFEDEYFDLVYSTDLTAGYGADSDGGGAILAYDDTERSYYDVSDSQSISIDGEPMYAKSTGTGQYVWAMTVEPMWKASNVIVTAYDSPGTYCNTNNWESDPTNTYVYVSCFNHNGEPANTQFTATFQLGAPTKAESE